MGTMVSGARFVVGDVFDVLAGIPGGSVDLVLTSPPFLALRSYLPGDHPDKGREIGSEVTPGAFIDTLLALTEEWARVLAPHGSICVELGDTYSGSGGAGGDYRPGGLRDGQQPFDGSASKWDRSSGRKAPGGQPYTNMFKGGGPGGPGWPMAKSLCLIPELYRISLVYGFNPLTGRTTPPWRARNVIRWCRPNPAPGALGDKVRPATSDMVVACKSARRFFDLDAVRQPLTERALSELAAGGVNGGESYQGEASDGSGYKGERTRRPAEGGGAPPLDHWWHDEYPQDAWHIPTQPYKGAHYATFPEELCVKPIEAMVPRKVCRTCGKPSERIVGDAEYVPTGKGLLPYHREGANSGSEVGSMKGKEHATRVAPTLGWSDCGHGDFRNGLVLDPFAGSGTTLAVAVGHGRDAIGIDLDARNAELARERCGMFLTVDGG